MNKVVAILGVIVVITLGALFFFAGFYMGNTTMFGKTTTLESKSESESAENPKKKKMTLQEINDKIRAQSNNVSEKVMKIISGSADNISSSVSKVMTKISHQKASKMSADSLLKEILASHSEHDDCSPEKTEKNIQSGAKYNKDSLRGKKVVFIGYFKDNIALQIQNLLINKGYKVHVEESKTCPGESFIFCGPFRKKENAETLANWLKDHDFSEAKVINIVQESVEKTIADTLDDDSTIPENEEEEIPEENKEQLQNLANSAKLPVTPQTVVPTVTTGTVRATGMPGSVRTVGPTGAVRIPTNYPQTSMQIPLANQMRNLQVNQTAIRR